MSSYFFLTLFSYTTNLDNYLHHQHLYPVQNATFPITFSMSKTTPFFLLLNHDGPQLIRLSIYRTSVLNKPRLSTFSSDKIELNWLVAVQHFFLFLQIKLSPKGRGFDEAETVRELVKRNSSKKLRRASCKKRFLRRKDTCDLCVRSRGRWFEGDSIPRKQNIIPRASPAKGMYKTIFTLSNPPLTSFALLTRLTVACSFSFFRKTDVAQEGGYCDDFVQRRAVLSAARMQGHVFKHIRFGVCTGAGSFRPNDAFSFAIFITLNLPSPPPAPQKTKKKRSASLLDVQITNNRWNVQFWDIREQINLRRKKKR